MLGVFCVVSHDRLLVLVDAILDIPRLNGFQPSEFEQWDCAAGAEDMFEGIFESANGAVNDLIDFG